MTAFVARVLLSGLVVALASTLGRRQPTLGALIVALPLVSVLSMIWLWRDGADAATMAGYVEGTFWYFLPTIPMFLLMPALLRGGVGFWPSLLAGCTLTVALYLPTVWLAARFGVRL